MTSADQILPLNASPLERALDRGRPDIGVPLASIVDADTTIESFIPWLASHEGVRLWWQDWPEARKRKIIKDWTRLASLIGTRAAAQAFLDYVDTTIVDRVSHPRRFVIGRAAIGLTPIAHKPFVAHFLLKVDLTIPPHSFIVGRSAIGWAALRTPSREPLRRAKQAIVMSKAPETLYSVNFGHRRPLTLDDGFDLDEGVPLGSFKDRKRL